MLAVLISCIGTARLSLRSRAELQLEILALRHQLQVLQRSRPGACGEPRSSIVKLDTVITWHRGAFRLFWTWKPRRRLGRPTVSADVRALIGTMSQANPLWGAPRIHGELLKLGIDVTHPTSTWTSEQLREAFPWDRHRGFSL
jgi:hypothetical protein